jgi:hypothetical protein
MFSYIQLNHTIDAKQIDELGFETHLTERQS